MNDNKECNLILSFKNEKFSLENKKLQEFIQEIEKLAFSPDRVKVLKYDTQDLSELYKKYEKLEEFSVAENFLKTGKTSPNIGIDTTIKYSKIEGDFASIGKDSKILFIGSGPYPETAITLHQLYGCKVHCVDRCEKSVDISQKILKKLQLDSYISVECCEGMSANFDSYTHIFLAAHLEEKEAFINKIQSGKIILARFGEQNRSFIYSNLDYKALFLNEIEILGELRNNDELIHSTVIFKKV